MKKLIALFLFCTACYGEPTPTPMPSPSPAISQPKLQWLTAASTDPTQPAGANPLTTYFVSKNRVIVTRLGDSYLITFEP